MNTVVSDTNYSNSATMRSISPGNETDSRTWKPLRFFNIYRFTLAGLFVLLYQLGPLPAPLGLESPRLFYQASLILLFFSLVTMVMIAKRQPSFMLQLHLDVLADIVLITVLMHASGGINSGLGMLLVISIANGSMISGGRTAGLLAALATISVLLEQAYTLLALPGVQFSFPRAGMLGAALFATAILAHVLARRASESEALATQRGIDLANMAQLTDFVIQQMTTGVLVVDSDYRIRLMNQSAQKLLGNHEKTNSDLGHASPELLDQLKQWQRNRFFRPTILELAGTEDEILPRFKSIGSNIGTVIFLEDATLASRQAQQMKLASLGRLSAGIAHEIRNPLGAISHAGELLAESPQLEKQDIRLTEIIQEQTKRVNSIIESVLQLGRRDRTQPVEIRLKQWLGQFVSDYLANKQLSEETIGVTSSEDLSIFFDADHLYQILTNLFENGQRHGSNTSQPARIEIRTGIEEGHPYLDVIDSGPGVPEEERAKIFEPFYTTASKGIGLGLYLCRELAGANRASLLYRPTDDGRSRFRLLFAIQQDVAQ